MTSLDAAALRAGALVALVFAVPFSVAARWLADRSTSSGLVPWLVLASLVGFVLGAGVAAWLQQRRLPYLHGMVCAMGTYLAAQAVFIAIKVARGGHVRWLGVLFTLTVVMFAGFLGGALGNALQRRGIQPTAVRGGRS